jgi:hypothetical protein
MTCFAKRQMSSRNCPNGRAEPIGDCRARVSIVSYSAGSLRHRTVQPSQHRPEAFQLALNEVVLPRPGSRGCNANKVRQTVSLNWRRRSRFSVCHRWHTIGTASWHPFFHRDGSIPLGHGFCVFGSRILREMRAPILRGSRCQVFSRLGANFGHLCCPKKPVNRAFRQSC